MTQSFADRLHAFMAPRRAMPLLIICALSLIPLSLIAIVNHDETQYHAAAYLVSRGLTPFVDFLYLQTPYQPYVFAPVIKLFAGYSFIASRLLTALFGIASMALLYGAARRLGIERWRAAIAALFLYFSHPFTFATAAIRNDALPLLLLCFALFVLFRSRREFAGPVGLFVAGLSVGLATGIKLSYAPVVVAMVLFPAIAYLFVREGKARMIGQSFTLAFGAATALLPILLFRDWAPDAFDYGVFGYHLHAPRDWYILNGMSWRFSAGGKALDIWVALVRGPALATILIYGWWRWNSLRRQRPQDPVTIALDCIAGAGFFAFVLPTPTWHQYLLPLLPPLYLAFAREWQVRAERGRFLGEHTKRSFYFFGLIGLIHPFVYLGMFLLSNQPTPFSVTREAHALGELVPDKATTVVSLSPEIVIDSGLQLDPEFSSGPFAYRTGHMRPDPLEEALPIVSFGTVQDYLSRTRPKVIVTGYENFDHVDRIGLERPIIEYAEKAGYRRVPSGDREAVYWLRED